MYVIYSQNQVAIPYTNFADTSVNATVNSLISNVSLRCRLEIVSGKSYAPLTALAYFNNGLSVSGVSLVNNQVTFKSSKPSVAKIKTTYYMPRITAHIHLRFRSIQILHYLQPRAM